MKSPCATLCKELKATIGTINKEIRNTTPENCADAISTLKGEDASLYYLIKEILMTTKEENHLGTEIKIKTEMVQRTAAYLTEVVDNLEVLARVQLARRNLKGAIVDLVTSNGASGITWMIEFTDEELIRDYRNAQLPNGATACKNSSLPSKRWKKKISVGGR